MMVDLNLGDDLMSTACRQKVLNQVVHADAVLLAPPCTTWSIARHGLRSRAHPRGLPNLADKEANLVKEGNSLADFSIRVAAAAALRGIPVVLEQPLTSRLWLTPQMKKLVRDTQSSLIDLDQCAFGSAWKKPTRLLLINLPDVNSLSRRCDARGSKCVFSKRPHFQLVGGHRTKAAAAYPCALCNTLADIFNDKIGWRRYLNIASGTRILSVLR